jgi:hypothetical protein
MLNNASYYKYEFNPNKQEFEICVMFNGEKFCYTSKPRLFNSELLLLVIKKNKVVFDKVNRYMKNDFIIDIENNKFSKVN